MVRALHVAARTRDGGTGADVTDVLLAVNHDEHRGHVRSAIMAPNSTTGREQARLAAAIMFPLVRVLFDNRRELLRKSDAGQAEATVFESRALVDQVDQGAR